MSAGVARPLTTIVGMPADLVPRSTSNPSRLPAGAPAGVVELASDRSTTASSSFSRRSSPSASP